MVDTAPQRLLLVEGQDDKHIVWRLKERSSPNLEFSIRAAGTVEKCIAAIVPEMQVADRKVLGVLVDADIHPQKRWNEVRSRFLEAGITVPKRPDLGGTVIDTGRSPRAGIWLMPDNKSAGEIENFIREMIPQRDPVWPLSQNYINAIPVKHQQFRQRKLLRAQLYAWLATRKLPGRTGAAIKAGDLNSQAANSKQFVAWLQAVFA